MVTDSERLGLAALLATCLLAIAPAHAQQATPDEGARIDDETVNKADESDIAKESQNPVGNLTILPLENHTNFGFGPHDGAQKSAVGRPQTSDRKER